MSQELSRLAADVRENLLYLKELGIESLAVQLPAETAPAAETSVNTVPSSVPRERLEKFVPEGLTISTKSVIPQPKSDQRPSGGSRLGLLQSTRLSNVKPPLISPPQTPRNETEMPVSKPVTETESPFGDIRSALPESTESIESIRADIGDCRRCELCTGRTKIAHSTGSFSADLMFVGEALGADEDAQGAPFVGRAGQLLTKI